MENQENNLTLFRLDCPACGAPLDITKDHISDDLIKCEYCNTIYNIHGNKIEQPKPEPHEEEIYSSTITSWIGNGSRYIFYIITGFLIIAISFPIVLSQSEKLSLTNSTSTVSNGVNSIFFNSIFFNSIFFIITVIVIIGIASTFLRKSL